MAAKQKSSKKEVRMLRERINELEEIIAVMDGDREQMRAKIEEGAAKSKE